MSGSLPQPDARARRSLRRRLCAWYRAERRDLPWRRTRDPYAVWISEAMLQQTRVEAVVDHWRRFLERFPDLPALAAADEDQVLAAWSGLGYYRRARSLRLAARAIVERHGGEFPRTRAEAEALPGVGPYTAGAVLSIAHDLPEALVDGNVVRVLARLFDLDLLPPALERAVWDLARALVPDGDERPGEWNQALMELGATVCTPRAPRCLICPVARSCRARGAGTVDLRPRSAPRPTPVEVELELAWVEREGALLLERRPPGGRMAGLWQLPTRERSASELFPTDWPPGVVAGQVELMRLSHGITRHRIRGRVLEGRLEGGAREALEWWSPAELASLGLTGMTKKALSRLRPEQGPGYPSRR